MRLLSYSILAIVIAGALITSPRIGIILLLATLVSIAIYFWLNPKFRYFRLAGVVVTSWLATRAIPSLDFLFLTEESAFHLFFGDSAPWAFDIAAAGLGIVLLILDDRLRNGDKVLRKFAAKITNLFVNNKQQAGDSSQQMQNVTLGNNSVLNQNYYAAEAENFNARIDVAAAFLKQLNPDLAIHHLEQLERHYLDRLSDREKYRIYANFGFAYGQKGEEDKSNQYLLKAATFQPNDPVALGLKAIALFGVGDEENARDVALQVVQLQPDEERANSVLIRTDSTAGTLDELERNVPSALRGSVEIVHALYWRAIRAEQLDFAESQARRIIELDSSNVRNNLLLASVLLNEVGNARKGKIILSAESRDAKLSEAIQLLDTILKEELPCKHTIARARYHRAFAHSYQGKDGLAESDFRESLQILPNDRDTAYQFGIFMMSRGKVDEAIELLQECSVNAEDPGPLLTLARLLVARNSAEDLPKVVSLLENEFDNLPDYRPSDQFDFADLLCRAYRKSDAPRSAREFLESFENILSANTVTTLRAEHELLEGNTDAATQQALLAKAAITDETPEMNLHYLAQVLGSLHMFSDALDVFKKFIKPCGFDDFVDMALDCAIRAEDHKFILQFCPQLRETGNETPFSIEMEIGALEVHSEFEQALSLIDTYLAKTPDEELAKCLRVRRSVLGVRLGRPELIEKRLEELPAPETVPAKVGCIVVSVLKESGEYEKAGSYAYCLLRQNFNEPEVHRCVATVFGIGDDAEFRFASPDSVEPGVAIRYREYGKTEDEWLVIEEQFSPNPMLNEIAPGSELARELVGKKTGDEFFLRKDSIQDRKATITLIVHKFEFRSFDCLYNFENRFRDEFLGHSYQIPTLPNGELDVATFVKALKKVERPIEELDSISKNSVITLSSYAQIAGRSIIETICHFAAEEELPVRCCRGTDAEFKRTELVLEQEGNIVLDPSAAATLFLLGIHNRNISLPSRFLISEGTLDLFRRVSQDPSRMFSKRRMGVIKGQMFLHETSDEELNENVDNFQRFYTWLGNNFETRGGIGKADIPIEKRKELSFMFGDAVVESVGLAGRENAALWTDDFAVAEVVLDELIAQRTWSDAVFEFLHVENVVSQSTLNEFKLNLIEFGYIFTRLSFDVTQMAFKRANWNWRDRQLLAVINWLHTSGVLPEGAFQHAAKMLELAWKEAPLGHQPADITKAICRSLAKRADGIELLTLLQSNLKTIFGVDIVSRQHVSKIIEQQTRLASKERLLILPGDPDWML